MKSNLKSSLTKIWSSITIEPVVALYLTSIGLNEVIRPNLLLDKACLQKLEYNSTVCGDLESDVWEDQLEEVQRAVSDYERNLSILAFVPRLIYALMAGAWSDRHGRKTIIALPIFGQFLLNITFIINYAFLEELPFEALYLEFVNELCGTFVLYYLAVYSYMADVTDKTTRTSRIALLDGTDYIFTMVGTLISGPLFESLGYYAVFSSSGVLALSAVAYVIFMVNESIHKQDEGLKTIENKVVDTVTASNKTYDSDVSSTYSVSGITSYGCVEKIGAKNCENETKKFNNDEENYGCCCKGVPKPSDLLAGFKTVLKPRTEKRRTLLLLIIFNYACYIFAYNGTEGSHRYLYAENKYGWDEQEFTVYLSVYRVFYLITLWVLVPIASKRIGLHDGTVAVIACLSGAIGQTLPAVTDPAWVFYLGSVINSFSPAATITARTLASRCVDEDEVGRIFAVISLMSAISSSLITAAYQSIYSATLDTFPGAFLLVNAGLFLLTIPNNLYFRKKIVW